MENPFFKSKLAYAAPEIAVFEGGGDGAFEGSQIPLGEEENHTNPAQFDLPV